MWGNRSTSKKRRQLWQYLSYLPSVIYLFIVHIPISLNFISSKEVVFICSLVTWIVFICSLVTWIVFICALVTWIVFIGSLDTWIGLNIVLQNVQYRTKLFFATILVLKYCTEHTSYAMSFWFSRIYFQIFSGTPELKSIEFPELFLLENLRSKDPRAISSTGRNRTRVKWKSAHPHCSKRCFRASKSFVISY